MICPVCGTPSSAGMRFCGMCGEPLAQAGQRERRRVSVVFVDLAAFTTLTHGFDPEELRDLADGVLTVVAGIIEDYDGYVDSFRGDGLIALFGAPRSHPDDPERAVRAAAASLRAIEEIGGSRGFPLRGRAGVNTGIVIAGAVGSGRVRDYTVMGSAVNLAARLEAAAEPGEVWVGPETYESTRHRLLYRVTPRVSLAGFPNVEHAYALVSPLARQDADPYADLRFVGRAEELALLERRYREAVEDRRAREVWVVGEAGSGKTRLLREFTEGPAAGAQVVWIEGKAAREFSWWPLGRQLFGLEEGEEKRVAQQKVAQALQRLLPDATHVHDQVLRSLGFEQAARGRPGTRGGDRAAAAWRDVLAAAARRGEALGMLVLVENEPQAPAFQSFLALLGEASAPLLVVRTSRGRQLPAGADGVVLGPLALEESMALLDQVANPALQAATRSLVLQVGGIPSYLLELGRALSHTQSGSFSGSLASLLQARLDMLDPADRQLLSYAALTGERCWEGLLVELTDGGDGRALERLTRERLLVQEAESSIPGEVEYRFQSELLRHAVLRMVPFADRPLVHLRIAAWLERHAPLALSESIGFHFKEGGSHDAAYPHYLAAADLAQGHDDERAAALYETLLQLDLPPALLAQGALAYAQAALARSDVRAALAQLEAADEWIGSADGEAAGELRRAWEQLRAEAEAHGARAGSRERAESDRERSESGRGRGESGQA